MSDLVNDIDKNNIPAHIAIIMDGNGRWAKKQGEIRIHGHKTAVRSVKEATEACSELKVKHLTLYAFSTENWNRPKEEVDALMQLLVDTLLAEIPDMHKNNIRFTAIGNLDSLPEKCNKQLQEAFKLTESNTGLNLNLALSYSGRWDIVHATKKIAEHVQKGILSVEDIDDNTFGKYLSTSEVPDVDLMIRTSGEYRISNFLLWEIAYGELYFTEVLWPDFTRKNLFEAIIHYQKRERRYGLTSAQLETKS